jgi:hypothetical protein
MKMSNTCQNCGNAVSDNFARVYGDNNDTVYRCMKCVSEERGGRKLLRNGGAAMKELPETHG